MLKNNGTNKCPYYYCDKEMFFSFNSKRSIDYNLFIVNKGDDLKFFNKTTKSITYETPLYQNWSYLLNAAQSQKQFSLNLAAEGLSSAQCGEMFKWLAVGETGLLILDNDPYWGWNVVISDLGDAIYYENAEGYIVTFSIQFTTIGSYNKRNALTNHGRVQSDGNIVINNTTYNDYGLPQLLEYNEDTKTLYFNSYTINPADVELSFNFETQQDANYILKIWVNKITSEDPTIEYNFITTLDKTVLAMSYDSKIKTLLIDGNLAEISKAISIKNSKVNLPGTINGIVPGPVVFEEKNGKMIATVPSNSYIVENKQNSPIIPYYEIQRSPLLAYSNTIYYPGSTVTQKLGYNYYLVKAPMFISWSLVKKITENSEISIPIYPEIEIVSYKN